MEGIFKDLKFVYQKEDKGKNYDSFINIDYLLKYKKYEVYISVSVPAWKLAYPHNKNLDCVSIDNEAWGFNGFNRYHMYWAYFDTEKEAKEWADKKEKEMRDEMLKMLNPDLI